MCILLTFVIFNFFSSCFWTIEREVPYCSSISRPKHYSSKTPFSLTTLTYTDFIDCFMFQIFKDYYQWLYTIICKTQGISLNKCKSLLYRTCSCWLKSDCFSSTDSYMLQLELWRDCQFSSISNPALTKNTNTILFNFFVCRIIYMKKKTISN